MRGELLHRKLLFTELCRKSMDFMSNSFPTKNKKIRWNKMQQIGKPMWSGVPLKSQIKYYDIMINV